MPLGMENNIHIAEETPGAINKMPDHFLRGCCYYIPRPVERDGSPGDWYSRGRQTGLPGKGGRSWVKIDVIVLELHGTC
jgi:hypothetical protein